MKHKIPSILGITVLVAGIAVGVALIGQQQIFRLGATGGAAPEDVRVSNISHSSFTVSWITQKETVGHVSWGTNTALGQLARQIESTNKRVHSVTINGLQPAANYYFVINSGGTEFDNNGVPWAVTTGPALSASTGTLLASGSVTKSDGTPADNVLVYINGGNISQLSATTSPNGTWTIPLSIARNRTLSGYADLSSGVELDIFVQAGQATAAAQISATTANPVPNITLGQTYDFRKSSNETFNLPKANVNLPEDSDEPTGPGGLDISGDPGSENEKTVSLGNLKEGEIVFTPTPEFFGDGPPNTILNVTIESEPVTLEVKTKPNGTWAFSPKTTLEDGEHTITIAWIDSQGFLRSLVRTFTVFAQEGEPGFVSTPSGSTNTPTPTLSPSPTTRPTQTPIATVTASPSPAPTRVSIPSTESGVPNAGSLAPTLILATVGLMLLLSGIVIVNKNA